MKYASVFVLLLITFTLSAQTPIDVYKGTVKIASVSEEMLYFSFAKGDQLVFDFESTTGRELMEFEILQYPHYSKFREDNKVKMQGRKVDIQETAVYLFRMANRSGTERNCKLHIKRIPGSASTKKFNTTVAWKTISDTTYTPATEKYVTRRDTAVINREAVVVVQGTQSRYGSTTQSPEFDLPGNAIAWSFYIGVNQQGQKFFQDATQKFTEANTASPSKISGYGPLSALALTGKSFFAAPSNTAGITYSIVDATNVQLARQQQPFKSFRSKKAITDYSIMKDPHDGKCFFYLKNETDANMEVTVKIAAVVVYEKWGERNFQKMEILKNKVPITAKP